MPRTTIVGDRFPTSRGRTVIFPCASRQDPETGRIAISYGAADTTCAPAFAEVDEVVDYIKAHPSKPLPS